MARTSRTEVDGAPVSPSAAAPAAPAAASEEVAALRAELEELRGEVHRLRLLTAPVTPDGLRSLLMTEMGSQCPALDAALNQRRAAILEETARREAEVEQHREVLRAQKREADQARKDEERARRAAQALDLIRRGNVTAFDPPPSAAVLLDHKDVKAAIGRLSQASNLRTPALVLAVGGFGELPPRPLWELPRAARAELRLSASIDVPLIRVALIEAEDLYRRLGTLRGAAGEAVTLAARAVLDDMPPGASLAAYADRSGVVCFAAQVAP